MELLLSHPNLLLLPRLAVRNFGKGKEAFCYLEKMRNNLTKSSSYESAMEALSSLITQKKRGEKVLGVTNDEKLERMRKYVEILDIEEGVKKLKIIHVAGTKGKGSTCTFCEAILRECGLRTGLFTSPHLIDVRERFRINGLDISEDKFLQYFWGCWTQLKENVTECLPMPVLFQFLTLLAFKIFINEEVDVAVIEVGLGGMYDSTNVIEKPIVCGITSLGMDHMETLGDSLVMIASHKAGIFKPQVPAFTVPQLPEAMDVIKKKARELMIPLDVAEPLDHKKLDGLKLGMSGDHQLVNSGLAVSLCKCWLQKTGHWERMFQNGFNVAKIPDAFLRGLSTANLSGRAQTVYDCYASSPNLTKQSENSKGNLVFYLDGAHSPESMEACANWFSSVVKGNQKSLHCFRAKNMDRDSGNDDPVKVLQEAGSPNISKQILLFNCMEVRDPQILLPQLVNTCASSGVHFSKALFVPTMSTYSKVSSGNSVSSSDIISKDLSWQFNLQRLWEKIMHGKDPDAIVDKDLKLDSERALPRYEDSHSSLSDNNFNGSAVMPSLPLAIKWLRDCVRDSPSIRLQVLVTGSLHLVGDVLKLLKR